MVWECELRPGKIARVIERLRSIRSHGAQFRRPPRPNTAGFLQARTLPLRVPRPNPLRAGLAREGSAHSGRRCIFIRKNPCRPGRGLRRFHALRAPVPRAQIATRPVRVEGRCQSAPSPADRADVGSVDKGIWVGTAGLPRRSPVGAKAGPRACLEGPIRHVEHSTSLVAFTYGDMHPPKIVPNRSESFRIVQNRSGPFRTVENCSGPFRTVENCSGPFRRVKGRQGRSGRGHAGQGRSGRVDLGPGWSAVSYRWERKPPAPLGDRPRSIPRL